LRWIKVPADGWSYRPVMKRTRVSAWRELVKGRPGRRFVRYHERMRKGASYRSMAAAIAVVLLGVLLSVTPGPGFVFVVLGAAMLAGRSRRVARALDRAEIRGRKAVRRLRRLTGPGVARQ
jgi:hypothetical protein